MVSDEAYAALRAENAALRQQGETLAAQIGRLTEQLAQALQRIAELEAKKTPPPAFVKANVLARTEPRSPRRKRVAEHNHARRREAPSVVMEHAITTCPDCGSRLGGVHAGRRRHTPPTTARPGRRSLDRA